MSDCAPIAVIGTAFRLPGSDSRRQFWRDIRAGTVHIHRFDAAELADIAPDDDHMAASALLSDIAGFDAEFFGMTEREATVMDPQLRLFLECCHHALEDGGYGAPGEDLRVGVYASAGFHLYPLHTYLHNNIDREPAGRSWAANVELIIGNYADFLATQTCYRLGLNGPAFSVQSACSSGLAALHVACQGLRSGDADIALAGAAAVHVPQVTAYERVRGTSLSPTGECRAFDAMSNGTVGGQGVAAVLLKRLDRALADGDTIHAVIEGIGVTNDGSGKRSYTAPSPTAQRDATLRALAQARVTPTDIGYVETHGTGTYKGDPIEFAGLTEAYRRHTDAVGFCALGANKPAIGHSDACSGFAGLIKAMLVLRHGEIPPLPNFVRPNPLLELEGSPFFLPSRVQQWPRNGKRRRAAVQAFGVGGTNVHVILAEPPERQHRGGHPAPDVVTLSARTEDALRDSARAQLAALDDSVGRNDVVTTLTLGRRSFSHRLVLPAGDLDSLRHGLSEYLRGGPSRVGVVPEEVAGIAFLASGQGGRLAGSARGLHARFPTVQRVLGLAEDVCPGGGGLLSLLTSVPGQRRVVPTSLAQPALFALQAALVELWREFGLGPAVVAGHSVGEFGALYAAGALTLADGVRLTARRGELMQAMAPGGMIAVLADRDRVDAILDAVPGLDLAAVNGPANHVLAGPSELLDRVRGLDGVDVRTLPIDRAFHSRMLDPVLPALAELFADVAIKPVELPFVSCVDGLVRAPGWLPDTAYFVASARQPVRFDAVRRTVDDLAGCAVELGPDGSLGVLPSIRHADDARTVFDTAAELFRLGHDPHWSRLFAGTAGARIPLPGYPFQHRDYWTGPPPLAVPPPSPADAHPSERIHDMPAVDSVVTRVVELTARYVGGEITDPRRPFTALGADSLHLVNMLRELEQQFTVRISMRELLEDADSPRLLADLIAQRAGLTVEPPAAPKVEPTVTPPPATSDTAPVTPPPANGYATQESVDRLAAQIQVLAQAQLDLVTQIGQLLASNRGGQ
ncbi:type I polyketide synthase [Kutzneria sp. NPDC052558]|uniref:type I polyketide synthase n=1 Tax=Kutzneria sp. NPDC052558 TaxID=3364121 RepID=UPI0037C688A8